MIVLCRAMQMTRIGYHAGAVRGKCERVRQDRVLSVHVAAGFECSRRICGSPRIWAEFRGDGLRIGPSSSPRAMAAPSDSSGPSWNSCSGCTDSAPSRSAARRSATSPTASTTTGSSGGSANERPQRTDAYCSGRLGETQRQLVSEGGCGTPATEPHASHFRLPRSVIETESRSYQFQPSSKVATCTTLGPADPCLIAQRDPST